MRKAELRERVAVAVPAGDLPASEPEPPWRKSQLTALLGLLALGAGVPAWFMVPRAYEGLTLLEPVSEHAYTVGGRPSPGTPLQHDFFEQTLPVFFIALDHGEEPRLAAQALDTGAVAAELPPPVLEAVSVFARACTSARPSADAALAGVQRPP